MSVTAYTGLPGHGKSYGVVEHVILPALRAGRHVVTNMPMEWDAVRDAYPEARWTVFDDKAVLQEPASILDVAVAGCVLVLDEAQLLFPSGVRDKDMPEAFRLLFSKHRHMVDGDGNSTQIVLVTQDLSGIAPFARRLVEQTFRVVKLVTVGAANRFRVDVFPGPVTGPSPPLSKRAREIYGKYRAEVWRFYRSHTLSEAGGSGANEAVIDKRGNILRSPMVVGGAVVALVALVWGVFAAYRFLHPAAEASSERAGSIVKAPAPSPLKRERLRARGDAAVSSAWRVSGTVRTGQLELDRAFLTDGSRSVSVPFARFCKATVEGWTVCFYRGMEVTSEWAPTREPGVQVNVVRPEAVVPVL